MQIFLFLTLLSLFLCESLRFSFIIFRHGARSPYDDLTSDFTDIFNYTWDGKKELTGIGQRQHFLIGARHRKRYIEEKKLISQKYDPREIYVISTDSNRTIMSAQSQLFGLYSNSNVILNEKQIQNSNPPNDEKYFKDEKEKLKNFVLPNQIEIPPIHQFFVKDHTIQLQDKKYCKGHDNLYENNEKRKEVVEFIDNFVNKYGQFLIDKMREQPKEKDIKKYYTYKKVYTVLDTLISIYTDGRNISKFGDKMNDLMNLSYHFFNLDFIGNNKENDINIGLYSMSPTFERIIEWMDLKIAKDKENEQYLGYDMPKLVLFSAHDSTVGAFEEFMYAVFNTSINYAYFASFANLELVKVNDTGVNGNNYEVYYYFDDKFIQKFNYVDFKNKVKNNLKSAEEIAKYCRFDEIFKQKNNLLSLIFTVILGFSGIILIFVNYLVWIKFKKNKDEYKVSGTLTEE